MASILYDVKAEVTEIVSESYGILTLHNKNGDRALFHINDLYLFNKKCQVSKPLGIVISVGTTVSCIAVRVNLHIKYLAVTVYVGGVPELDTFFSEFIMERDNLPRPKDGQVYTGIIKKIAFPLALLAMINVDGTMVPVLVVLADLEDTTMGKFACEDAVFVVFRGPQFVNNIHSFLVPHLIYKMEWKKNVTNPVVLFPPKPGSAFTQPVSLGQLFKEQPLVKKMVKLVGNVAITRSPTNVVVTEITPHENQEAIIISVIPIEYEKGDSQAILVTEKLSLPFPVQFSSRDVPYGWKEFEYFSYLPVMKRMGIRFGKSPCLTSFIPLYNVYSDTEPPWKLWNLAVAVFPSGELDLIYVPEVLMVGLESHVNPLNCWLKIKMEQSIYYERGHIVPGVVVHEDSGRVNVYEFAQDVVFVNGKKLSPVSSLEHMALSKTIHVQIELESDSKLKSVHLEMSKNYVQLKDAFATIVIENEKKTDLPEEIPTNCTKNGNKNNKKTKTSEKIVRQQESNEIDGKQANNSVDCISCGISLNSNGISLPEKLENVSGTLIGILPRGIAHMMVRITRKKRVNVVLKWENLEGCTSLQEFQELVKKRTCVFADISWVKCEVILYHATVAWLKNKPEKKWFHEILTDADIAEIVAKLKLLTLFKTVDQPEQNRGTSDRIIQNNSLDANENKSNDIALRQQITERSDDDIFSLNYLGPIVINSKPRNLPAMAENVTGVLVEMLPSGIAYAVGKIAKRKMVNIVMRWENLKCCPSLDEFKKLVQKRTCLYVDLELIKRELILYRVTLAWLERKPVGEVSYRKLAQANIAEITAKLLTALNDTQKEVDAAKGNGDKKNNNNELFTLKEIIDTIFHKKSNTTKNPVVEEVVSGTNEEPDKISKAIDTCFEKKAAIFLQKFNEKVDTEVHREIMGDIVMQIRKNDKIASENKGEKYKKIHAKKFVQIFSEQLKLLGIDDNAADSKFSGTQQSVVEKERKDQSTKGGGEVGDSADVQEDKEEINELKCAESMANVMHNTNCEKDDDHTSNIMLDSGMCDTTKKPTAEEKSEKQIQKEGDDLNECKEMSEILKSTNDLFIAVHNISSEKNEQNGDSDKDNKLHSKGQFSSFGSNECSSELCLDPSEVAIEPQISVEQVVKPEQFSVLVADQESQIFKVGNVISAPSDICEAKSMPLKRSKKKKWRKIENVDFFSPQQSMVPYKTYEARVTCIESPNAVVATITLGDEKFDVFVLNTFFTPPRFTRPLLESEPLAIFLSLGDKLYVNASPRLPENEHKYKYEWFAVQAWTEEEEENVELQKSVSEEKQELEDDKEDVLEGTIIFLAESHGFIEDSTTNKDYLFLRRNAYLFHTSLASLDLSSIFKIGDVVRYRYIKDENTVQVWMGESKNMRESMLQITQFCNKNSIATDKMIALVKALGAQNTQPAQLYLPNTPMPSTPSSESRSECSDISCYDTAGCDDDGDADMSSDSNIYHSVSDSGTDEVSDPPISHHDISLFERSDPTDIDKPNDFEENSHIDESVSFATATLDESVSFATTTSDESVNFATATLDESENFLKIPGIGKFDVINAKILDSLNTTHTDRFDSAVPSTSQRRNSDSGLCKYFQRFISSKDILINEEFPANTAINPVFCTDANRLQNVPNCVPSPDNMVQMPKETDELEKETGLMEYSVKIAQSSASNADETYIVQTDLTTNPAVDQKQIEMTLLCDTMGTKVESLGLNSDATTQTDQELTDETLLLRYQNNSVHNCSLCFYDVPAENGLTQNSIVDEHMTDSVPSLENMDNTGENVLTSSNVAENNDLIQNSRIGQILVSSLRRVLPSDQTNEPLMLATLENEMYHMLRRVSSRLTGSTNLVQGWMEMLQNSAALQAERSSQTLSTGNVLFFQHYTDNL